MASEQKPNGHTQVPNALDAVDRLSDELDEIEPAAVDGGTAYVRHGLVFAVREGSTLSFRLLPEVVAAALRTPDTSSSPRGTDWISLNAAAQDPFVLDRALAWFESAWRLAGGAPDGPHRIH
jgi:hypothetical protein